MLSSRAYYQCWSPVVVVPVHWQKEPLQCEQRSISSLNFEAMFGWFQDLDHNGSTTLRADCIPPASKTTVCIFTHTLNPQGGFAMNTSIEKGIYFCVYFITKSFLTYSFFPPIPAISNISRPLSSSMCSITPETANVGSSYNRMRGPGIGCWFSDRSNCSHWSLTLALTLISENISLYTTLLLLLVLIQLHTYIYSYIYISSMSCIQQYTFDRESLNTPNGILEI